MQLSPLIFTLATFLTPCHHWKGSGFKKGVCAHCCTPWVCPLWCHWHGHFHWRSPGSFLWCHPLPAVSMGICSQCFYQLAVMDEVVQAATMIAAFLFFLGVFHGSHQVHYELLHDPINTVGSLLSTSLSFLALLLFQMCQVCSRCFNCWLGPFELSQGEETSHHGFGSVIICLASG